MKRITFLVSGNGGTLKFLYRTLKYIYPIGEINTVIADRDCGAYNFAKRNNINVYRIEYNKNYDQELVELLSQIKADFIITNIHKILTKNVLSSTKAKFINLHYSLLPAYAGEIGMATVKKAKKNNNTIIGTTCHEVNEILDGGKIICQSAFPVDWTEPDEIIFDRVFKTACITLLNSLFLLINYNSQSFPSPNNFIFSPKLKFDITPFDDKFWKQIRQ